LIIKFTPDNHTRNHSLVVGSSKNIATAGFTLLEIMVVVVIITILSSYVMLNLQDRDKTIQLEQETKRLKQIISLAREEAILNSEVLGLRFRQVCYTLVSRNNNEWKAYNNNIFGPHEIPAGIELHLLIDDVSTPLPREQTPKFPQIVIWQSGELTPFELILKSSITQTSYSLTGNDFGDVEIVKQK
jgi:general secretion pathway protein H